MLPGGFYLALGLRWLRLKLQRLFTIAPELPESPGKSPDPVYQEIFRREILAPLAKDYFQSELHQLENLPEDSPVMVTINHAGMCFPWDFINLGFLLSKHRPWFVQPLAHPLFFDHPWLKWWLPCGWSEALGGVRAERSSFETAISNQTVVLYAPEGWRGLAKGWYQRYQLARFDPSFVQLSLQYQVPIVPVICLGSENLHPWTVNVRWLADRLRLPLFPISPLMLLFLLFPSMGVWAARSRLRYYIQPVWYPWKDEIRPSPAGQPLPRRAVYRMAASLRSRLQATIDSLQKPEAKPKLHPGDF